MQKHSEVDSSTARKAEEALLSSDWESFYKHRYDVMPEGYTFKVIGRDLSGKNFEGLSMQFLCFEECNLEGADFSDNDLFVVAFRNCNLTGADLRGTSGLVYAWNSDFSEVLFDDDTNFADIDRFETASKFKSSDIDEEFAEHLRSSGAEFEITDPRELAYFDWG